MNRKRKPRTGRQGDRAERELKANFNFCNDIEVLLFLLLFLHLFFSLLVVVVAAALIVTKLTTKVIKDQTQVGAEAGLSSSPQAHGMSCKAVEGGEWEVTVRARARGQLTQHTQGTHSGQIEK